MVRFGWLVRFMVLGLCLLGDWYGNSSVEAAPVRMQVVDGDVRAVVVEDGAGAVDDFLVALDLRHDLLLHLQRRQGDLVITNPPGAEIRLCHATGTCNRIGLELLGVQ